MADDHQSVERTLPTESFVEYCLGNITARTRKRLQESNFRTDGTACLGRCGDCFAEPFLIVDGEYVPGNHEELINVLGGDR